MLGDWAWSKRRIGSHGPRLKVQHLEALEPRHRLGPKRPSPQPFPLRGQQPAALGRFLLRLPPAANARNVNPSSIAAGRGSGSLLASPAPQPWALAAPARPGRPNGSRTGRLDAWAVPARRGRIEGRFRKPAHRCGGGGGPRESEGNERPRSRRRRASADPWPQHGPPIPDGGDTARGNKPHRDHPRMPYLHPFRTAALVNHPPDQAPPDDFACRALPVPVCQLHAVNSTLAPTGRPRQDAPGTQSAFDRNDGTLQYHPFTQALLSNPTTAPTRRKGRSQDANKPSSQSTHGRHRSGGKIRRHLRTLGFHKVPPRRARNRRERQGCRPHPARCPAERAAGQQRRLPRAAFLQPTGPLRVRARDQAPPQFSPH